ncbi:MAG: hypothetical protein IKB64_07525 [Paludibacteraceae bacterium]|nr:hypothetical protein [Paludibacteraceae bacterium]
MINTLYHANCNKYDYDSIYQRLYLQKNNKKEALNHKDLRLLAIGLIIPFYLTG